MTSEDLTILGALAQRGIDLAEEKAIATFGITTTRQLDEMAPTSFSELRAKVKGLTGVSSMRTTE